MNEQADKNIQKGIKFDATLGQFMSAVALVILLFVLPVGGYEYINGRLGNNTREVYTNQSSQNTKTGVTDTGSVAGISTTKAQENAEEVGNIAGFVVKSTTLMVFGGVLLVAVAMAFGISFVYDFWKR